MQTPSPQLNGQAPQSGMQSHISIQEQTGTDRPVGISALYRKLCSKFDDPHKAEHEMMECLGRMLWEAQRSNLPPDEQQYLDALRRLAGE